MGIACLPSCSRTDRDGVPVHARPAKAPARDGNLAAQILRAESSMVDPRPSRTSGIPRFVEEKLRRRWLALYGNDRGAAALPDLLEQLTRWRSILAPTSPPSAGGPGAGTSGGAPAILIAYGDHLRRPGETPLSTLAAWCRTHLAGCVSAIHVLPFHPSTSYEGYAITDYFAVDPALGTWSDLENLQCDFDLMVDWVLNHCSSAHPWFAQFRANEEPGRRYFITVDNPDEVWLKYVPRARSSPLLHPVATRTGVRHVWTTYAEDLVDLNWDEPALCREMLEVLLDSVARGVRIVRLDAFVYVWKAPGTNCIDQPGNHELLRFFQDVLEAVGRPDVALLPSITNVGQEENFTYFGPDRGDREADLIYLLPLSAMLLQSLYAGEAASLRRWLAGVPAAPAGCAYLNLAASHDGIGLTWLKGILDDRKIAGMLDLAQQRGALLSSRKPTAGTAEAPWEINSTWFSACAPAPGAPASDHVERFLLTQSIVLALRGVPALYLPLFLAAENDHDRVSRTGDPRAINRGRFEVAEWERSVADAGSTPATVLRRMTAMLRARAAHPAFHPEGGQRVLDVGDPAVLAIERVPPECPSGHPGGVLCLFHFGAAPVTLGPPPHGCPGAPGIAWQGLDLLRGERVGPVERLTLSPWRTLWLVAGASPNPTASGGGPA